LHLSTPADSFHFTQGVIVKKSSRLFSALALGAAAMACGMSAQAQTTTSSSGSGAWYAPAGGYIGFNAGQSNYRQGCGTGLFSCGDKDDAFSIYGGSMLNNNFGLELGYFDMGDIGRAGGTTEARGLNLSLVGRVPLGERVGLFGKLGTTYGSTKVSSSPGSGVTAGDEDGFGVSVGVGVNFDINQNWSAVLQWDRHEMKFAGIGREPVHATTIGVKYRF
jgi:OOP family OmpA-OmpF porin